MDLGPKPSRNLQGEPSEALVVWIFCERGAQELKPLGQTTRFDIRVRIPERLRVDPLLGLLALLDQLADLIDAVLEPSIFGAKPQQIGQRGVRPSQITSAQLLQCALF